MTRVREPLLWITHILPGAGALKTILNGHFKALASGQAFDFIIWSGGTLFTIMHPIYWTDNFLLTVGTSRQLLGLSNIKN